MSVSVSELESRPGYLGGGLEALGADDEDDDEDAPDGPGIARLAAGGGGGGASRGLTLLSCMSLFPLMSPLLLSSSSSGAAMFSCDM